MSKKPAATWRMTDALAAKLRSFEGKVRLRRFAEGEQLYRQDEVNSCFYFVKSGLVQVSIFRRDGTEVVLENMGPNALCGEGAAFDGLPRFSTAVAVEPTEALEFDTAKLESLIRDDPEFALAMLRLTSLKQRILALRLEHLVSNDPEERILELLNRLQPGRIEPEKAIITKQATVSPPPELAYIVMAVPLIAVIIYFVVAYINKPTPPSWPYEPFAMTTTGPR